MHARTLLPAALASVPFGFVLVRVRARACGGGVQQALSGPFCEVSDAIARAKTLRIFHILRPGGRMVSLPRRSRFSLSVTTARALSACLSQRRLRMSRNARLISELSDH